MSKFTNFKSWKSNQQKAVKEEDTQQPNKDKNVVSGNAELLALIEDLSNKRNLASRAKDGIGRQIYDLDIRVAQLEMQKNELLSKKKDLENAKSLAETKKRVPRTSHE